MTLWSTILYKLKEIFSKMFGTQTIERELHMSPIISSQMEEAIKLWGDMYSDKAPWLHEPNYENPVRITSLGLPALIASEKARTALLELQSEITTPVEEVEVDNPNYIEPEPDEFGNIRPSAEPKMIVEERVLGDTSRAAFLSQQFQKVLDNLRTQIEYGIAKGGLVFKPYVIINKDESDGEVKTTYELECDYIQAENFYPLAFDNSNRITEAAFIQTKTSKDYIYRRLEYHKWENNTVTVINKAYKSTANNRSDNNGVDLGTEIKLTEVPEWASLQPEVVVKNVNKPLFAYFKMPEANTIDTSSPLGVSAYSRAVKLIKDADYQYSRLLWEYEAGEMAIDIDVNATRTVLDENGVSHSSMGMMQQRLYRRLDLGEDDTYNQFAPNLRDAQYIQGINAILMRIEDCLGLSRGVISDVTEEARTATELKILRQRTYQTNQHIQNAIEKTLKDVIYIMDVYCTLYNITPEGKYEASFEWDDSILTDKDEELSKRITLQLNRLTSRLENRMWFFGETKRQAQEALKRIDEETIQMMQNQALFQNPSNEDGEYHGFEGQQGEQGEKNPKDKGGDSLFK